MINVKFKKVSCNTLILLLCFSTAQLFYGCKETIVSEGVLLKDNDSTNHQKYSQTILVKVKSESEYLINTLLLSEDEFLNSVRNINVEERANFKLILHFEYDFSEVSLQYLKEQLQKEGFKDITIVS